jgi:Fe2+ transport system protein B
VPACGGITQISRGFPGQPDRDGQQEEPDEFGARAARDHQHHGHFSMMVLIWFLASFPRPPAAATDPAINYSLAAMIGHALEPVLTPVGFNWQINVALIPGMAAREVAIAALGTVYAIEGGEEGSRRLRRSISDRSHGERTTQYPLPVFAVSFSALWLSAQA